MTDDVVVKAVLAWLQSDQSHPAWSLIAGKFLLLGPDVAAHPTIMQDLIARIQRHPNAGAWHKLQTIYQARTADDESVAKNAVLAALLQRKASAAWTTVKAKHQSGETILAQVTKQDHKSVSVELENGLFARMRVVDQFRYPRGSTLPVVIEKINTKFDFIIVRPDWRDPASQVAVNLVPGQVYEGIVTGHQRHCIFVRIHGQSGILRSRHLPGAKVVPEDFPKGSTLKVRLIEKVAKGLELALA